MTASPARIDAFIARWQGREGGQERANYALFLTELCGVLDVPQPEPAAATSEENDYVFERVVKGQATDGSAGSGRIDLYKRGCFVLEAKQSRQTGGAKEVPHYSPGLEPPRRGVRDASRTWDVLMLNARRQAEGYARALPVAHGWPPFILVCDVGHVIETYADFSGQGKNYAQFPDRQSFRVYLEDLRRPDIRERLARIWTDPMGLDPARETARVTREIAARLAAVSKALEEQGHDAEEVAMFLMRCLFTMFAEDVELLPKSSFRDLLQRCEQDPSRFKPMVGQLWEAMDRGDFAFALETRVRRFNGEFFRTRTALALGREEICELRLAASANWKEVDPSIFGTLLEQALDKSERRRLGAHYTPRAYVERLVVATIIEPLRADWDQALSTAERQKSEGRLQHAEATIRAFHVKLCNTRVLDPACGTGNFLYVALELLKRLEGEVLEALVNLGGQEALTGLERHTVDPHQFLGLEINPRAAAIAELVLWIGYLQWHFRTQDGMPGEPILRAFRNILVQDALVEAEVILARDEQGLPITWRRPDGEVAEEYSYENPRHPTWPEAEFIVGNPPFTAGQDFRREFGNRYAEALWRIYPDISGGAHIVMFWWYRAAGLLAATNSTLKRFGLVSTNSMTQDFSRRVVELWMRGRHPVSVIMAIPNHPWHKAARGAAAVRIAMTVVARGDLSGTLLETVSEQNLDTDEPQITFREAVGIINPNLTIGVDVTTAIALLSNVGVCSDGVKLHGAGFIIDARQASHLGFGRLPGADAVIRPFLSGRDVNQHARQRFVIDLFGLEPQDIQATFPAVYQHVKLEVKERRDSQGRLIGRDTNNRATYRERWWLFGEPRSEIRPALEGLDRFMVTVDTSPHRIFQFVQSGTVCDDGLVLIAHDDAWVLGVLSSRVHTTWARASGGWLGVGDDPRWNKTKVFDPFPFPDATPVCTAEIRSTAEAIDRNRKRVLADHPHLTLTGLYNVLEKLRAGTAPDALDPADRRIFDDGLVLILKELHDRLDVAVAAAYGWPAGLSDNDILARLVALNQERVREEAAGNIRWLRPDYQVPRFGTARDKLALTGGAMHAPAAVATAGPKPSFPASELEQTAAVLSLLTSVAEPATATALAARFRQGRRVLPQVEAVLAALVRVGGLVHSPDGGRSFLPRRVA
ncbi:MAG TPA: type IIL restriction-modification enzyme MmeI [Acetobacteraceae bacterium]|jgi:SAM-dependent methyltransferase